MKCDCAKSRSSRAYTLIEVLIVVTIIGIAGAVVVPRMLAAGTLGVQAAARMVIADILYAQNDAVAQQKPRQVIFTPDADQYRLADAEGTTLHVNWRGGSSENYIVDFQKDSRFQGVDLVSADFDGETSLTFDDMGAPSSGGTIVIQFESTKYRINVAAFTGRVTVEKL